MAYTDKLLDHYENPRNVGVLDKNAKNIGTGIVGAPACGDVMKLQIQVDDNGMIVDAKFKTFGVDLRSLRALLQQNGSKVRILILRKK